MTIDNATGLPQVPEGYYWDIYAGLASEYLTIELRRRFWGVFSRKVEWTVVRKAKANPHSIRISAGYLMDRFMSEKPANDWKKYVGTYPPNKLQP